MPSTNDAFPESSLTLSKQETLKIREKCVKLFQELEGIRNDQHRVNIQLDKENQASIDASHLCRQVQLVEVNLDNATTRINHLATQLIEIFKVSEAARHIGIDLENQSIAVKDKEFDLDDELRKSKECSIETDKRFQKNACKLTELQERIEHAERRSTIAERRIVSLEQDIRHAYTEMKLLIQAEEKTQIKEEKYRKNIEDLESQLKSAQQRTDAAETDVGKLQLKVDKLKEKLVDERNKCHQIEKMINASSTS